MRNLLNENITLRCESQYNCNKYEDLQKLETNENNDYTQNFELLQKDIELLKSELQHKEEDLVVKTKMKKQYIDVSIFISVLIKIKIKYPMHRHKEKYLWFTKTGLNLYFYVVYSQYFLRA